MMRVLINGATAGTNFGDYLFAQMFQDYIEKMVGKENVCWYKNRFTYSDFFARNLKNLNAYKLDEIDALVYMSGGYFCGNDKRFKDYLFRYLNYFHIGFQCMWRGIPYAIIGVEVGHSDNAFIEAIQKKILREAEVVVVRNRNSYDVVKELGIDKVFCTADSVFAMEDTFFADRVISHKIEACPKRKLFLHIHPWIEKNAELEAKVIPIINSWIEKHDDYAVVVSTDQDGIEQDAAVNRVAGMIKASTIIKNHYDDPIALCKVINCCDVVVTTKLHVGIVGMRLGKSVISFSEHSKKIERLYEQFGEKERTVPLKELKFEQGVDMLERYYAKPICVMDEITIAAKSNFKTLENFISTVKRRGK